MAPERLRLFLDTGVIIEGCTRPWGASKAVCILATQRRHYTVVLAEAVEGELRRVLTRKAAAIPSTEASAVAAGVAGWLDRVRLERWPLPSAAEIQMHKPTLLPLIRHVNDLGAVVTALQARPDWVISSNRIHWSNELAAQTGLQVVSPAEFLEHLSPT